MTGTPTPAARGHEIGRLTIREHDMVYRGTGDSPVATPEQRTAHSLPPEDFDRLRRFDRRRAEESGQPVFRWYDRSAKAASWVGVIELRGVSVEILPKIGTDAAHRSTFIKMLQRAGFLSFRRRGYAGQSTVEGSLLDSLVRLYADRLHFELRRGVASDYQTRRENLHTVKGKLQLTEHLTRNRHRDNRFFVEYDEFVPDVPLNRIIKAACRRMLGLIDDVSVSHVLRRCMAMLDRVADVSVTEDLLDRTSVDRTTERFRDILQFSKLVLTRSTPTLVGGETDSFALLFDMNRVFESYVAALLSEDILADPEFSDWCLSEQGGRKSTYLLNRLTRDGSNSTKREPVLRLMPDFVLENNALDTILRILVDTKWKELRAESGARGRVERSDLFQMTTYARQFGAQEAILLYPAIENARHGESYEIQGAPRREQREATVRVLHLQLPT
jgi:5-methylcytosine-specific restriction enzyme subunit McrC